MTHVQPSLGDAGPVSLTRTMPKFTHSKLEVAFSRLVVFSLFHPLPTLTLEADTHKANLAKQT